MNKKPFILIHTNVVGYTKAKWYRKSRLDKAVNRDTKICLRQKEASNKEFSWCHGKTELFLHVAEVHDCIICTQMVLAEFAVVPIVVNIDYKGQGSQNETLWNTFHNCNWTGLDVSSILVGSYWLIFRNISNVTMKLWFMTPGDVIHICPVNKLYISVHQ